MKYLNNPIAGCMRWGKWGANFSEREFLYMIESCVENEIDVFDHADIYGDYTTEADFGNSLKALPSLRQKLKIITKCGIKMIAESRPQHQIKSYDTSYQHIVRSAEISLKNFHTDYLDVFLIHRPDPLLNPEEVAKAVDKLKQEGKILQFGVSNFLPHQLNTLKKFTQIEYNQIEVSIIYLSPFTNGILDNCIEQNIIPMAWSPLGGGILNDDAHPKYRRIMKAASELAEKYKTGLNQILISFLQTHPSKILPVIGTTKLERLLQAKEASKIILEREDWFKLYSASTGDDVP